MLNEVQQQILSLSVSSKPIGQKWPVSGNSTNHIHLGLEVLASLQLYGSGGLKYDNMSGVDRHTR